MINNGISIDLNHFTNDEVKNLNTFPRLMIFSHDKQRFTRSNETFENHWNRPEFFRENLLLLITETAATSSFTTTFSFHKLLQ